MGEILPNTWCSKVNSVTAYDCFAAGAEKAGYAGYMVTVDAPRLGNRIADERNK